MIGHCGVVALPAALGFLARQLDDAGPAEVHLQPAVLDVDPATRRSRPACEMPLSVPPPRRKYIAGCRSLVAPAQPPMKCAGGAEPLIRNTQT